MIEFKILKKSDRSRARLGLLKTGHGTIETPAFVPVATNGVVKTLTNGEAAAAGSQILIANTFHLHLKPGEKVIAANGGLHQFTGWLRPLMTDSGGFQVFSLGFGKDLQIGKVLNFFPGRALERLKQSDSPSSLRINDDGVLFRSPLDGQEIWLGPKESIRIQEKLDADIIFAFDECTSPAASQKYAAESLNRTRHWAKVCLTAKKSDQALFGVVQGSHYKNLRLRAAQEISALDFDGVGIGGDMGADKNQMNKILSWVIPHLKENKPRHMLGIGYLADMTILVKWGIDLFDCTVPTHFARHGIAFTSGGKIDLNKSGFLRDRRPLDPKCVCQVCTATSRSLLAHLIRAKEILGLRHLTFHNLYFFNQQIFLLRQKIKNGKI